MTITRFLLEASSAAFAAIVKKITTTKDSKPAGDTAKSPKNTGTEKQPISNRARRTFEMMEPFVPLSAALLQMYGSQDPTTACQAMCHRSSAFPRRPAETARQATAAGRLRVHRCPRM
eukprot:TRINITY_DN14608_c0_g1_i1.p2 TRINITY_DN14608_c0_g1~~TRINITY_DN14608_c0_g1_i1.p2  ORF type:complete len:118 (-),score=17.33 TRINITY_DN14608_c0_g1_i1:210-563(-)